jgi:hypothetical protein
MRRMPVVARLVAVALVGCVAVVIGLAGGRVLNTVRQAPEASFEPFAPPPAASTSGALALPAHCDAGIAIAAGGRFTDLAWSADSSTLAATSAPPGESLPRIVLFYGPDWKAHDIGPGRGPRWSAGGLLAFERPERPGALRIVDAHSGHEVGQIADTASAYGWDAEAVVFFRGGELRTWRDGTEELRAVVGSSYTPGKPYLARFSGDGSRFVVERRENGKITELFLGDTKDGRASPLAAPVSYSFAPSGKRLILDFADRLTLFAEATASATIMKTDIAGTFAGWSPDGRRALFRTSTSALLGWDVMRVDEVARTATGTGGEITFAPSGRWLASLNTGSLSIGPCVDLPADPRVKLTHDDAIHLISARPDVVNIRKLEAKLVLWAEIERNHAKGMFPSFASAAPNAPVWLACLSGEVQRPAGWNPPFAKPTYSIGLYVLDATDGHELALQATDGTWCIGDGFDDLHEYGTLPPAWTPPTSPYPTPVLKLDYTVANQGATAFVKSEGGWSITVPKEWFVSSDVVRFGAAVLTNYEPDVYGSYTSLVMPQAPARMRLTLEMWANDQKLPLDEWVDRAFAGGMTRIISARSTTTLAGRDATVLTEDQSIGPPPLGKQIARVWIVPRDDETMLVMHALPADSTALRDAERALGTLQLAAPSPAPNATVTKDAAITIATGPVSGAKPAPIVRIERTEAKLVRWMDLRSITGPFQGPAPGPLSAAPDAPIWVVAVSGDLGMTSGVCRGPVACPSTPIRWSVVYVDARTGAIRSTSTSTAGDWPAFFDPLPDRSS